MIRRRGRRRRRRRICRRMGPRNSSGLKPIIFRFKSHKKKTELHKARKYLKSVSLNQYFHDTNKICIYINENLTYSRRKLFAKVYLFYLFIYYFPTIKITQALHYTKMWRGDLRKPQGLYEEAPSLQ